MKKGLYQVIIPYPQVTQPTKKISGGLRSISVTVVRISFIQEAYMAINRILPPTKLAGHHPRTRLKWVKWLNPENSELSSCSGWHPRFVFYSPWPMQETLNCSSCRVRYWIFMARIAKKFSEILGKLMWVITRMEMKFCKVCPILNPSESLHHVKGSWNPQARLRHFSKTCSVYPWELRHFVSFARPHSPWFFETPLLPPLLLIRKCQRVDSRHGAGVSTLLPLSELESTQSRRQGKAKYRSRFRAGQMRLAKRFCGEFIKFH